MMGFQISPIICCLINISFDNNELNKYFSDKKSSSIFVPYIIVSRKKSPNINSIKKIQKKYNISSNDSIVCIFPELLEPEKTPFDYIIQFKSINAFTPWCDEFLKGGDRNRNFSK